MIDKQKASELGYRVTDSASVLAQKQAEKIEQLKELLPGLVDSDGLVSLRVLQDLLGKESIANSNQGYALGFAGKGLAHAEADRDSSKELKVERAQSKDFDRTENLIVRGDNLDALKILRQNYEGKVKCIYIDPPYNTGNDSFIYRDNFKENLATLVQEYGLQEDTINFLSNIYGTQSHSGWLWFMYPRLRLARHLLSDDGVIFISIDDHEQANLKIMCDEIFGEENFVGNIAWKKTSGDNKPAFAFTHDNILIYGKSNAEAFRSPLTFEQKKQYQNSDGDPRGDWAETDYRSRWTKSERPNLYYFIEHPKTKEKIFPDSFSQTSRVWGCDEMTHKKNEADNLIYWGKDGLSKEPKRKRFLSKHGGVNIRSVWLEAGTNDEAGRELKKLFSDTTENIFDNPKPTKLIKKMLYQITKDDDIVLDFFAGSGTTAHAVMELNKEDGGKRKFIMVQWDEKIPEKNAAYNFCQENKLAPVISSICIERIKRVGEKIRQEEDLLNDKLDVGYKVFSLTKRPRLQSSEQSELKLDNKRTTYEDTLYNMLVASCKKTTAAITEIEKGRLYQVEGDYYVLGQCQKDLTSIKSQYLYIDGYAEIKLENWLNMLGLDKENVEIIY